MVNAYKEIINYSDEDEQFEEYLKKMHLYSIFQELINDFPDKNTFKGVVRFILMAYSVNSELLQTSGWTWTNLSKRIFEMSNLDEKYFDEVADLKNDSVRDVAEKWLQFQNDENFTNYCHFRDLRREMLSSSIGKIIKSTGEQDYEQKMKNAIHSVELLKMMEDAREKFIQTQPKLKVSVSELNKVNHSKSTKTTEEIFASHGN